MIFTFDIQVPGVLNLASKHLKVFNSTFPVSWILGMKFKIEFVVLELCSTDTWSNRILINFSYYFQLLENPTQSNALRRFCLLVVFFNIVPFWLFLLVHFVSFKSVSNIVTQVSHDVFWSERVSPVFFVCSLSLIYSDHLLREVLHDYHLFGYISVTVDE